MIKKTITYTDYNDNQRTEDYYFNLSKAELIELNMNYDGGLEQVLTHMTQTQDAKQIMAFLKSIIITAYGEKSPDGRRFNKSEELSNSFIQSEAYSELLGELLSDANKAAEFMNGVIPKALADEVAKSPEMADLQKKLNA